MITRDNFRSIVLQLSDKDKKRILKSSKQYCVLYLSVFNVGSVTTCTLTDNFLRYQNVSNDGNAILEIDEIRDILTMEIK